MPLWCIAVEAPAETEEAIAELLARIFGQSASSYTRVESRSTRLTVYVQRRPRGNRWRKEFSAGIARIQSAGLEPGHANITIRRLRRQDWAESWKRHFRPLEFGASLLIRPTWSRRKPKRGQAVVALDPGLSFGTGQHATTAFCLRQVVDFRRKGQEQSFLDVGTGSGVLALSAASLGYATVDAFDHDPVAVKIAQANARKNRLAQRVRFFQADIRRLARPRAGSYSLVCANLVANLLLSERERLLAFLQPDGRLVLAGILASEFARLQAAYAAAGLRLVTSRREREWRSGSFARTSEDA